MSELLYFALQYAEMGFEVFPVVRGTKDEYFHYPEFKNPETGSDHSWQYQASKDPELIKRFWTDHPEANIGIATGQRSGGLFVIDMDQKDNRKGSENFRKWIDDSELWIPDTIRVRSPSGGEHLYFINAEKDPVPKREFWLPGVDIRGENSYIIAPPSYINKAHGYKGKDGSYEFIVGITEIENIPSGNDCADILSIALEIRQKPKAYTILQEFYDSEGIPDYKEVPFVPVEGTNTEHWKAEHREGSTLKTSFSRTASGKVPKGERHSYLVSRIGSLVNKLGSDFSSESILEMVIQDYYENCEDPDSRDENEAAFRKKCLSTVQTFQKRKEAEDKDPDFYKYSMKAWRAENPGVDFDSSGASWDDVAAAGLRAKEDGKVFDQIRTKTKDPPSVRTPSEENNDQEGSIGMDSAEPEKEVDQDPEERKLEQFHLHDSKGRITGVFDYEIHRYLKETEHIFVMGKVPYIYVSGAYRADESGATLMTMIKRLMYPRFVKSNTIRRIYDLFISDAELQKSFEDLNQYPEEWICFKNGFYDPVNKCLVAHDPKYCAINQLPIEYDPAAAPEGPTVNKWLTFICEDPEEREMLLEYAGYCMNRDTRQQKFLILVGEGGTGKSKVISMIDKMIGPENISSIPLVRLNQRFVSYNLLGKLLNSCADLEVSALEDVTTLKKILGEDFISGEPKGKSEIRFKSYAKLIFSTNELPIVKAEKTQGFYRRLLVLRMDKRPEKKDINFLGLLFREHDYFVHECVEALCRMYERGPIIESKRSQEEVERLRMDSDTVEAFLAEETVPDPHGFIIRSQLFNAYTEYCRDMERTAYTKNNFFKSMRIKGYSEAKVNSGIQRGMVAFRGISFRNFAAENAAEDFQDLEEVPNPFSLISGSGE